MYVLETLSTLIIKNSYFSNYASALTVQACPASQKIVVKQLFFVYMTIHVASLFTK